jgi:hypothetical protein
VVRDLHDGAQRRFVHAIFTLELAGPASRTTGSLAAGVESIARGLPVAVDVSVPEERFPSEIESSAYFVVAEALTNVAKHSGAKHANVAARVEDGSLRFVWRSGPARALTSARGEPLVTSTWAVAVHWPLTPLSVRQRSPDPSSDASVGRR